MDETDTLKKELKKQFDSLPAEVQTAITSVDIPAKLQEIVKNNKLMIDQAGNLEMETRLVLFGLEPIDNYVKNLIKNVGLSSIQASVVAHDVNELIFKGVRETLKAMNDVILEAEKKAAIEPQKNISPSREEVLAGIEHPENIKNDEQSISISSLPSNKAGIETLEMMGKGIEIRPNDLPQIVPNAIKPIVPNVPKPQGPIHLNIPPVQNIVQSKLNETVIVPKQIVIVEEKTKLPEKNKLGGDPYRESII